MTAASVLGHFIALTLVTVLAAGLPPAPPEVPAIPIVFVPSALPPTVQAVASAALAPARAHRAATVLAPAARAIVVRAVQRPVSTARNHASFAQVTAALPPASDSSAAPAPRPAAMPPVIDDGAILLRFADGIHALVRASATMPDAAVRQHREGRAQVRFAYLDGRVQQVAVAQSSQSRLLDDAAMQAVEHAHYPPPPPQLRGRVLPLLVWIDFRIQSPG